MAVTAGLEHASGDVVVVIDADLQDPPRVIKEMVERWARASTSRMASGRNARARPPSRSGRPRYFTGSSIALGRAIPSTPATSASWTAGRQRAPGHAGTGSLRARDGGVGRVPAEDAGPLPRGPVRRHTKYPLEKMLRFATDGILSFSLVPSAAGRLPRVCGLRARSCRHPSTPWYSGFTDTVGHRLDTAFIRQCFPRRRAALFLGVIGEYLGRVYGEVKRRPLYVVKQRLGFAVASQPAPSEEDGRERAVVARWLKPVIGLAVTAAFLWPLVRRDVETLGRAFGELSLPFLALALAFLATGYTVRIVRWWWMLRALEPSVPLSACVWPYLTSIAINNVMPFRAGDALRVFGFRRQLRSPAVRVLGALVIERIARPGRPPQAFSSLGLIGLPSGIFPEALLSSGTAWLAGLEHGRGLGSDTCSRHGSVGSCSASPRTRCSSPSRNLSAAVVDHGGHFIGALGLVRSPSRLLGLCGAVDACLGV